MLLVDVIVVAVCPFLLLYHSMYTCPGPVNHQNQLESMRQKTLAHHALNCEGTMFPAISANEATPSAL